MFPCTKIPQFQCDVEIGALMKLHCNLSQYFGEINGRCGTPDSSSVTHECLTILLALLQNRVLLL